MFHLNERHKEVESPFDYSCRYRSSNRVCFVGFSMLMIKILILERIFGYF